MPLGAGEVSEFAKRTFEDLVVEECKRIEGLILGRRRDVEGLCEVREERMDFWCAHFEWVSFVMKENESFDPLDICFYSSGAEVSEGGGSTDLVEEFWWWHCRGGFLELLAAHPSRVGHIVVSAQYFPPLKRTTRKHIPQQPQHFRSQFITY